MLRVYKIPHNFTTQPLRAVRVVFHPWCRDGCAGVRVGGGVGVQRHSVLGGVGVQRHSVTLI